MVVGATRLRGAKKKSIYILRDYNATGRSGYPGTGEIGRRRNKGGKVYFSGGKGRVIGAYR